jgi:hypothetical protein
VEFQRHGELRISKSSAAGRLCAWSASNTASQRMSNAVDAETARSGQTRPCSFLFNCVSLWLSYGRSATEAQRIPVALLSGFVQTVEPRPEFA